MKNQTKIAELSDEQLLYEYKSTTDVDYFGVLYNRYIPLIYGVCLKYLGNEEKAQDAVMQIFEDMIPKVLEHSVNNFRTWIYSVTKNHCLQQLREGKKNIITDYYEDFMESDEVLHLLDEGNAEEESKFMKLEDCLNKLPEPQKKCIHKFFWSKESYADIVESTSYSLKSVKSYIQNGKRNLKNCMKGIL